MLYICFVLPRSRAAILLSAILTFAVLTSAILFLAEFADWTWEEFKGKMLGASQNCSATKGNHVMSNKLKPSKVGVLFFCHFRTLIQSHKSSFTPLKLDHWLRCPQPTPPPLSATSSIPTQPYALCSPPPQPSPPSRKTGGQTGL